MKVQVLAAWFIFSLFAPLATAETYYIDPVSGADTSACGASATPCQTLTYSVSKALPGDIWIARDGAYTNPACSDPNNDMLVTISRAGTAAAPITLKAEHKYGAILDAQMRCHSSVNFGAGSAYWVLQDFEIENGFSGGIWLNSKGGKYITIKGNHIHNIGNRVNSTQIGEAGIYTNDSAIITIDGNVINDIGRISGGTNSFDHGIYVRGNANIVNNMIYNMSSGWHIQTGSGFQGLIANNNFLGPNMYLTVRKQGAIMLWDRASGPIAIYNNIFYNQYDYAVSYYSFTPKQGCTISYNITTTPAVFQGTAKQCTTPGSSNLTSTDPSFVAPSSGDFHLAATSPAIDRGVTVTVAPTDLDGVQRPQGAGYDIGAYEFVATPIPSAQAAKTPVTPKSIAEFGIIKGK